MMHVLEARIIKIYCTKIMNIGSSFFKLQKIKQLLLYKGLYS